MANVQVFHVNPITMVHQRMAVAFDVPQSIIDKKLVNMMMDTLDPFVNYTIHIDSEQHSATVWIKNHYNAVESVYLFSM